ncbi:hypothetical protein CPAR01_01082 [Colletotrichum paranaense]|uniref:Uncharacterized protein n=1 Tax=Colletotrichum paranaense TaxID=1914294 RepID=A0ABQ9T652_9PEZI|nr:uncharacterized protein CPAR01_01082 [Colletotrichum paranaense]KAK1547115.1 hypothetical protein CPAR01_01082 [Colletotrichum paranaense]
MATFFHLPRELRHIIYQLYVMSDGGYVLNPETNKLRDALGRPIDLAFAYTCKRAADEMRGLALEANTITVSTFYSPDERHRARDFDLVTMMLNEELENALHCSQHLLWDDTYDDISGAFPEFTPVLDMIRHDSWGISTRQGPWGEPHSVYRDFVRFALRAILSTNDRHRLNDDFTELSYNINDTQHLLDMEPNPWTIPRQHDLRQIMDALGGKHSIRKFGLERFWMGPECARRAMFRYSAAAVAIRFLESNTPATRAHMRDIVLIEDQESVSNPECHAMGLIPYCQENPELRIERRVSLWRNAFFHLPGEALGERTHQDYNLGLDANKISYAVARWVIEVLPLVPAGMPAKSFTLVLDGEGEPQCSEIFQTVVLRDAAWQQAMEECFQSGALPSEPYGMRRNTQRTPLLGFFPAYNNCYLFDKFPQVMQEIVDGTSIVRCNFGTGDFVDTEPFKLVAKKGLWSVDHWRFHWYERQKKTYQPSPPLPSWSDIKSGYLSDRHVAFTPSLTEMMSSSSAPQGLRW